MGSRATAAIALLVASIVVLLGAITWSLADEGGTTKVPHATGAAGTAKRQRLRHERDFRAAIRKEQDNHSCR